MSGAVPSQSRFGIAALAAALLLIAGQSSPPPAYAATMVVTTVADFTATDGLCSLREAMINAIENAAIWPDCPAGSTFAADTITFAQDGTYALLLSALPSVVANGPGGVVIEGTGRTVIISGASRFRPFHVAAGASLEVRNLTVTQGVAINSGGGAFENLGSLTVVNTSITHSVAGSGGAIDNAGSLNVRGSSFRANSAAFNGGAINGSGLISNSTFTDNRAARGGAIAAQSATIINTTITGNHASNLGGGVAVPSTVSPGGTFANTIIAGNTTSSQGPDCLGSFTAGPDNIVQNPTGCSFTGFGSPPLAVDPLLGPLASNGGPTRTHALLAGSPAIDAGDAAVCAAVPVSGKDQRGVNRPQGAGCDIGAYEVEVLTVGGKNLTIGTGSIDLSWDGGTAQSSYSLLRYNTATAAAKLFPVAGNATTYSDATATNGIIYCYILSALNGGGGVLGLSDLLCGMAGAQTGTVIPQNFKLKLGGTTTASITWAAPPGGADSYLLQVIPLDGSPITNVPLGGGETTTDQPVTVAGSCFQLVAFKAPDFGTSDVLCGVPGVGTLGTGKAGPNKTRARTAADAMADLRMRLSDLRRAEVLGQAR